jgi:hypothetical protein
VVGKNEFVSREKMKNLIEDAKKILQAEINDMKIL